MKKVCFLKNKKGMTLVEIVIVMAIVAILIIPIGEMFITGTRIVARTKDRAYAKDTVLMVQDYVVNRLKFARNIDITSIPTTPSTTIQNIYIDARGLIHCTASGEKIVYDRNFMGDNIISLEFNKSPSNNKVIDVTVSAKRNDGGVIEEIYKVKTGVRCINMTTASVPSTSGSVIEFIIP
nr:prepilin-type N-terminal cleavage/methylation domain-containing protein [uncultured Niameybacter sp.]